MVQSHRGDSHAMVTRQRHGLFPYNQPSSAGAPIEVRVVTEDTKRLWDVILNIITMIGAAAAFWVGWYQWRLGQSWKRASKGRKLVNDLLKSKDSDEEYYAWDAMKMLDYQDAKRPFTTKPLSQDIGNNILAKRPFHVNNTVIKGALESSKRDETDPRLLYVRECFDELYFKLGQLQVAIDNKLVDLKHVYSPIDYYVALMAKDKRQHLEYLQKYEYQLTIRFLNNFDVWVGG
jgi:hypothetical protein